VLALIRYALASLLHGQRFIRQIDGANIDTEVIILGRDRSARLRDLLPFNEWPDPLD
jgi:hypothetical protein